MIASDSASSPNQGICAICQCPLLPSEKSGRCPSCHSRYHSECWQSNGGCAVYGCTRVPVTEGWNELEIPASYWGQEKKECPACGSLIQATAVRCRQCGAVFDSARPQNRAAYARHKTIKSRQPWLRKGIAGLFLLALTPITAPLAGMIALGLFFLKREELRALPALYRSLCGLSAAVGLGQTLLVALMTLIFYLTR